MMAEGANSRGYRHTVRTYAARDLAPETYVSTIIFVRTRTHDGPDFNHYISKNKFVELINSSSSCSHHAEIIPQISGPS